METTSFHSKSDAYDELTEIFIPDESDDPVDPVEQKSFFGSIGTTLWGLAENAKYLTSIVKQKALYEPNLTTVGISQGQIASNKIYDTVNSILKDDPKANFLFISSPMTRTITTSLLATKRVFLEFQDKIIDDIVVMPYISEYLNVAGKLGLDYQNSIVQSTDLIARIKFIKETFLWGFNHKIFYDLNLLADLLICIDDEIFDNLKRDTKIDTNIFNFLKFLKEQRCSDKTLIYFGENAFEHCKIKTDVIFSKTISKVLIDFFKYENGTKKDEQFISNDTPVTLYTSIQTHMDKFPEWFKKKHKKILNPEYFTGSRVNFSKYMELEGKIKYDDLNISNHAKFMEILIEYINLQKKFSNENNIYVFIFSHGNFIRKQVCNDTNDKKGKEIIDSLHHFAGRGGHIPNTCIVKETYNYKSIIIELMKSEPEPYINIRDKLEIIYAPNLVDENIKKLYGFVYDKDINICRTQSIKGFNNFYLPEQVETFFSKITDHASSKKKREELDTMIQHFGFDSSNKVAEKYYEKGEFAGGNKYEKKYLKYKQKYLLLKKNLE
jgi:hypothetical protein